MTELPKKTEKETEQQLALEQLAAAARRKAAAAVAKQRKLIQNLRGDLEKHGDPDKWKRFGDLLLANAGSATRNGNAVLVTDYFDEDSPTIEIEGDENCPVSEIAEGYFKRYTKARNGVRFIAERIAKTEAAIKAGEARLSEIDAAIEAGDSDFLASLAEAPKQSKPLGRKKKAEAAFKGARRFVSSDGYTILVGKKAKDNDHLTFRVAGSLDLWLHAADYSGSHVVIRNLNRTVIPNRTLTEAAQLAAFYSDARSQIKADVRYTQKKFVNKPKRSAPGWLAWQALEQYWSSQRSGKQSSTTREAFLRYFGDGLSDKLAGY